MENTLGGGKVDASKAEPKSRATHSQEVATMSDEEKKTMIAMAWDRLMKSKRVEVRGKTMSLKSLYESVMKREQAFSRGLYGGMGYENARGGNEKQILSPEEESELQLQRMGFGAWGKGDRGLGAVLKKLQSSDSGTTDAMFTYGIFCRPERVQQALSRKWAHRNPKEVLSSSRFTFDILRKCHSMEMTLMLLAMKQIPLSIAQNAAREQLRTSIDTVSQANKTNTEDLESFISLFDEKRVKDCDWVENGNIKKGTHLIFSSTPFGGLVAEAISPGPLSKRKTTIIGKSDNPILTAACFESFVGKNAIDEIGRQRCLHAILWCANGLSTNTRGPNPDTRISEVDLDGTELLRPDQIIEELPMSTKIFFYEEDNMKRPKRLLG